MEIRTEPTVYRSKKHGPIFGNSCFFVYLPNEMIYLRRWMIENDVTSEYLDAKWDTESVTPRSRIWGATSVPTGHPIYFRVLKNLHWFELKWM